MGTGRWGAVRDAVLDRVDAPDRDETARMLDRAADLVSAATDQDAARRNVAAVLEMDARLRRARAVGDGQVFAVQEGDLHLHAGDEVPRPPRRDAKEPPRGEGNQLNTGAFVHSVRGADMHVFGTSVPLYTVRPWSRSEPVDPETLRGLPSQALDSRNRVVRFTGRSADLQELRTWRDSADPFAVRWLFGPGGQGKTRLADEFAAASVQAGWQVVVAEHGPGNLAAPRGQHDLGAGGSAGLLLIVDYADRWPFTHLIWLFSNGILHTGGPTRVLLLARGIEIWPALQAALRREYNTYRFDLSEQALPPLPNTPDGREAMFRAAVDGFAQVYGLTDRAGVEPAGSLADPELGLTLAVHMSALVGVDLRVTGARAPAGMRELTRYLIDREHLHWALRYGDTTHELNPSERTYRTSPDVMHHTVFAAALTGSMARAAGTALVEKLDLAGDADRILTDHTTCYPPVSSSAPAVLEPLQPDRLAEDLLALSTPGHDLAYPAQGWAPRTIGTLLATPQILTRGVIYLAAATQRWPHVGERALYPLVRSRPEMVVRAGNAALLALNAIEDLPVDVLEAIESGFPQRPDPDVDIGIAAIAERLTDHRLAVTSDEAERARLQHILAWRLSNAGRPDTALPRIRSAVAGLATLMMSDIVTHGTAYVLALNDLASCLSELGRESEAGEVVEQVVVIYRAQGPLPEPGRLAYAGSVRGLAAIRAAEGRPHEAIDLLGEAVEIHRSLAGHRIDGAGNAADEVYEAELAAALGDLAGLLATTGELPPALASSEESADLFRALARRNPSAYRAELLGALIVQAMARSDNGRPHAALPIIHEAVTMARELAEVNPAIFVPPLATALNDLSVIQAAAGDDAASLAPAEEALVLRRQLAARNPDLFLPALAGTLLNNGAALFSVGRLAEGVERLRESVAVHRELCEANPMAHLNGFRSAAQVLDQMLMHSQRFPEAALARRENETAEERFAEVVQQVEHDLEGRRPSLLDGALLAASARPWDGNLANIVLLALEWDHTGATAIVLNVASPNSLTVVFQGAVAHWAPAAADPAVLFWGGSEQDTAFCLGFLRPGATPVDGMNHIFGPLFTVPLDGDPATIMPLLETLRIYAGCVRYGPGELDELVRRGDLIPLRPATTEPFTADPERLHDDLLRGGYQ
ncbi:hypothetical protein [Actinoplanes sp. HUAS TT8]|uniref:hypothetical protein n=1 Tax=Actinoplanes sp. HUAS TT8 TaxID=3447453 RepID=UPI003F51F7B9